MMHSLLALLVTLAASGASLQDTKAKPTDTKPAQAAQAAPEADAKIAAQLPSYPLTTCPVSGEELTSMGKPFDTVHEGRLVRLCCKSCVKDFQKDPAAVIAKIDAAVIEQQKASYPLEKCPVSSEVLGSMGDPLDMVHGTRLVRLCCKGCVKEFQKDPGKYMAQVDEGLIRAQRATYPLDKCIVSGESLSSMGEPVDVLYGTKLVRFCCKKCVPEFQKKPAEYLAKIDAARKPM